MMKNAVRRRLLAVLATACLAATGGCANAVAFRGIDLLKRQEAAVIAVPQVSQSRYFQCGYAALASVAVYYGIDMSALVSPEVVSQYSCRALSAEQLAGMSRRLGLQAYAYEGSLDDLKANVGKGRPLIAMLDGPPRTGRALSGKWLNESLGAIAPEPHWVVVVGVLDGGRLLLHDPLNGCVAMAGSAFERAWGKKGNVCVLVTPA